MKHIQRRECRILEVLQLLLLPFLLLALPIRPAVAALAGLCAGDDGHLSTTKVSSGSNYCATASTADSLSLTADLTWAAWIKVKRMDVSSDRLAILTLGSNDNLYTNDFHVISVRPSATAGSAQLDWDWWSGVDAAKSAVVPFLDRWVHVAGVSSSISVHGGSSYRAMYMNGANIFQDRPGSDVHILQARITVGAYLGCNSMQFGGGIDEVRLYSSALSASEINGGYSGNNWPTTALRAWYPANNPIAISGGVLADASSNGFDATFPTTESADSFEFGNPPCETISSQCPAGTQDDGHVLIAPGNCAKLDTTVAAAALPLAYHDFSISFYVRRSQLLANGVAAVLLSYGTDASTPFSQLRIGYVGYSAGGGDNLFMDFSEPEVLSSLPQVDISLDDWIHIALVVRSAAQHPLTASGSVGAGGSRTLYRNAAAWVTDATMTEDFRGGGLLSIGAASSSSVSCGSSFPSTIAMDELRIWSRALTSSEVASPFLSHPDPTGLLLHYPFSAATSTPMTLSDAAPHTAASSPMSATWLSAPSFESTHFVCTPARFIVVGMSSNGATATAALIAGTTPTLSIAPAVAPGSGGVSVTVAVATVPASGYTASFTLSFSAGPGGLVSQGATLPTLPAGPTVVQLTLTPGGTDAAHFASNVVLLTVRSASPAAVSIAVTPQTLYPSQLATVSAAFVGADAWAEQSTTPFEILVTATGGTFLSGTNKMRLASSSDVSALQWQPSAVGSVTFSFAPSVANPHYALSTTSLVVTVQNLVGSPMCANRSEDGYAQIGGASVQPNQCLQRTANPKLDISGDFTFSFWLKLASLPSSRYIAFTVGNEVTNSMLQLAIKADGSANGAIGFYYYGADDAQTASLRLSPVGRWMHVVGIYQSKSQHGGNSQRQLWVDGALKMMDHTYFDLSTSGPVTVGCFLGCQQCIDGAIDELRFFSRAWTVSATLDEVALAFQQNIINTNSQIAMYGFPFTAGSDAVPDQAAAGLYPLVGMTSPGISWAGDTGVCGTVAQTPFAITCSPPAGSSSFVNASVTSVACTASIAVPVPSSSSVVLNLQALGGTASAPSLTFTAAGSQSFTITFPAGNKQLNFTSSIGGTAARIFLPAPKLTWLRQSTVTVSCVPSPLLYQSQRAVCWVSPNAAPSASVTVQLGVPGSGSLNTSALVFTSAAPLAFAYTADLTVGPVSIPYTLGGASQAEFGPPATQAFTVQARNNVTISCASNSLYAGQVLQCSATPQLAPPTGPLELQLTISAGTGTLTPSVPLSFPAGSAAPLYFNLTSLTAPSTVTIQFAVSGADEAAFVAPQPQSFTILPAPVPSDCPIPSWLPRLRIVPPASVLRSTSSQFLASMMAGCTSLPGDAVYSWSWSVAVAAPENEVSPPLPQTSVFASAERTLFVPPLTLELGVSYRVWLTLTLSSVSGGITGSRRLLASGASVSANVSVVVTPSALVASIAGADIRSRPASSAILLDGSASSDPDGSTLAFSWSCASITSVATPCSVPVALRNHSTLLLPAGYLQVSQTAEFTLLVSSSAGGFARNASKSVRVTGTGTTRAPLVSITSNAVNGFVNSADAVVLQSKVVSQSTTRVANMLYRWSATPLVDCRQPANLVGPVDAPNLLLARGLLQSGVTYVFTVVVTDPSLGNTDASSSASIIVRVNSPPVPGSCTVQPLVGVAFQQVFVVSCTNWTDRNGGVQQPLTFTTVLVSSGGTEQLLTPALPQGESAGTVLPAGEVQLKACVSNTAGASTCLLLPSINVTASQAQQRDPLCFALGTSSTSLATAIAQQDVVTALTLITQLAELLAQSAGTPSSCLASDVAKELIDGLVAVANLTHTCDTKRMFAQSLEAITADGPFTAAEMNTLQALMTRAIANLCPGDDVSLGETLSNLVTDCASVAIVTALMQSLLQQSMSGGVAGSSALFNVTNLLATSSRADLTTGMTLNLPSGPITLTADDIAAVIALPPALTTTDLDSYSSSNTNPLGVDIRSVTFGPEFANCHPSGTYQPVGGSTDITVVTSGGAPIQVPIELGLQVNSSILDQCSQPQLECGFFNETSHAWSTAGCVSLGMDPDGHTQRCRCTHQTEFALLARSASLGGVCATDTTSVMNLIFLVLYSVLGFVALIQMLRAVRVSWFHHWLLVTEHGLVVCICLTRAVNQAIFYHRISQLSFSTMAILSGLPFLFISWLFSFVIVAWRTILANTEKGGSTSRERDSFATYRTEFIVFNTLVSCTLFGLFVIMSQSSSVDTIQHLTTAGDGIVAALSVLLALGFAITGSALVRALTADFKSRVSFKLGATAASLSTAFLFSAGVLLYGELQRGDLTAHFELLNSLYFGSDLIGLAIILLLFRKAVRDCELQHGARASVNRRWVVSTKTAEQMPQLPVVYTQEGKMKALPSEIDEHSRSSTSRGSSEGAQRFVVRSAEETAPPASTTAAAPSPPPAALLAEEGSDSAVHPSPTTMPFSSPTRNSMILQTPLSPSAIGSLEMQQLALGSPDSAYDEANVTEAERARLRLAHMWHLHQSIDQDATGSSSHAKQWQHARTRVKDYMQGRNIAGGRYQLPSAADLHRSSSVEQRRPSSEFDQQRGPVSSSGVSSGTAGQFSSLSSGSSVVAGGQGPASPATRPVHSPAGAASSHMRSGSLDSIASNVGGSRSPAWTRLESRRSGVPSPLKAALPPPVPEGSSSLSRAFRRSSGSISGSAGLVSSVAASSPPGGLSSHLAAQNRLLARIPSLSPAMMPPAAVPSVSSQRGTPLPLLERRISTPPGTGSSLTTSEAQAAAPVAAASDSGRFLPGEAAEASEGST